MVSDVTDNAASDELPEIAGYRLLRVINHGGMSTVYLARQHSLGRDVAIKVMSTHALTDEVSRRRFENEVRTIARLEHPHVVRIHEVGRTTEGLPYYAMPYMARGHLGQRDYTKSERRVVEIVMTLLSTLSYAHSRNIVHRDVKAENVLFDDADRPLLADFGIALRKDWGGARMTAIGLAVGSTAYMAPEQARGEVVDGRADLYALGVLMWEMLTGKLPFEAVDALSMAVMHAQDPVPKLPAHLAHWQHFMNRALAKQPAHRFEDAAQMRAGIESVMQRSLWPALRDRLHRLAPLRHYAKPIWAVCALLAFIGVGMLAVEHLPQNRTPQVSPGAVDNAVHSDVTAAMLKPLPESPARKAVETARKRIAAGQLTSPINANAYTSVLEAWNADSTHADVYAVVTELTNAFGNAIATQLRDGNDARAREVYAMATALGQQTGTAGSPAYKRLRAKTEAAIKARFEIAAKRYDREDAQRTAQLVVDFGLPTQLGADFAKRAQALPRMGATLPGGGVLRESPRGGALAINSKPVSRGEYGRFANASGRDAALCRERASLLRMIAPRDWRSPGFFQSESEPVVCVSLQDAEAYANWYSRQTGQHWRLPTVAEADKTPSDASGRDVSLWSRDCGSDCSKRKASGKSWRSGLAQRALVANRGYDDVGFRLVRDL